METVPGAGTPGQCGAGPPAQSRHHPVPPPQLAMRPALLPSSRCVQSLPHPDFDNHKGSGPLSFHPSPEKCLTHGDHSKHTEVTLTAL